MLHKVVIVDGFPGCGKTMLSPIISAFGRVEIMQYAPFIEQICELWGLKRIDDDVAEALLKMNADLLIYNVMMGRNTNCRPTDLSSIFKHKPLQYLIRMFKQGDKLIPEIIDKNKPILHLTTHMLLPYFKPLTNAFADKLIFIEVVRHPLYMIIQHEKNILMINDPRIQHINYLYNNKEYSFFCNGWEDEFDNSNSFERAIYSINWYYSMLFSMGNDGFIYIPFELFVKQPDKYMAQLALALDSPVSPNVLKVMKKQKVPRKLLCDAPALDIYKRCGWTPPSFFSEEQELEVRKEYISKKVSNKAMSVLNDISEKYTCMFLQA